MKGSSSSAGPTDGMAGPVHSIGSSTKYHGTPSGVGSIVSSSKARYRLDRFDLDGECSRRADTPALGRAASPSSLSLPLLLMRAAVPPSPLTLSNESRTEDG